MRTDRAIIANTVIFMPVSPHTQDFASAAKEGWRSARNVGHNKHRRRGARSTPENHLALALHGMESAPLLIHTQMIYLRIFSSQARDNRDLDQGDLAAGIRQHTELFGVDQLPECPAGIAKSKLN